MIGTIAGVLLGLVFLLSGGSKVAAGPKWPTEAAALGAPEAVVPVIPWFELVLGGLLVVQIAAPWPAVVAVATLLVFTGFLVLRLRGGNRPPCACFGAWSTKPLGWGHVVRNLCFVAIGIVAIVA
jgi:uncharacterized membrane protein YphA (DoxX/SURF4 family)